MISIAHCMCDVELKRVKQSYLGIDLGVSMEEIQNLL